MSEREEKCKACGGNDNWMWNSQGYRSMGHGLEWFSETTCTSCSAMLVKAERRHAEKTPLAYGEVRLW